MAFSSLLKAATLRGPAIKSLTNQILRSSSICLQSKHLNEVNKPSLAPVGSSQILAKYFNTTPVRHSAAGHDHVGIWKVERVLSVALVPLIPAALAMPNPFLDTLVGAIIVMHTHWGLEAIVVDYIRPILFGDIGPKIGMGLLYVFSAVTLAGILNITYNDVGLANAFLAIWKL